jgi:hypothetical protein
MDDADEPSVVVWPAPSAPPLSQWAVSLDDEPVEDGSSVAPAPPSVGTPLLSGAAKDAPRPGAPAGGWQSVAPPLGISPSPAPSAPAWDLPPPTLPGLPQLVPAPPSATCLLRLVLSAAMWGMVLSVFFQFVGKDLQQPVGIGAACVYALYVVLYLFSGASTALCNMDSSTAAQAYFAYLRTAPTTITASISCWHYETRTRLVRYQSEDKKWKTRVETYQERVDTHTASENWRVGSVRDGSGPAPHFPGEALVQVRVSQVLDFADARASAVFHAWLQDFFARNNRDTHHSKQTKMNIVGFDKKHLMMLSDDETRKAPLLANPVLHTLLVILGVAALYELCVLRRIPRARWLLVKNVSV